MRCHGAGRTATTVPGATAGPQLEVGGANLPFWLVECGVFNTTTTAFAVAVQRFTASGTIQAGVTEVSADDETYVPTSIVSNVNSTASTLAGGPYTQASIGAAVGAGIIWTFGKNGLHVPGTADAGVTIIVPTGTGQHFDFYFIWEE